MPPVDPAKLLPTVAPSTAVPDPAIHLNVRPTMFGGYQAQGLQELGTDALRAGKVWGEIAADDAANTFQEEANKILHGDPNKTITRPDGTTTTDQGYLGLKGRAALDQREEYEGRLKKLFDKQQGQMLSFDQQRSFDNLTRRYRAVISSQMGTHANTAANAYGLEVNKAGVRLQAAAIGANPENEEAFLHHTADMVDFATKAAELRGATKGDAMWLEAQQSAKAAAAETRIMAIGAKDPRRALEMAEHYKGELGAHYATVVGHFRARAEQQNGRDVADRIATGEPPPEGHDAMAAVRHFEGFREEPYWDRNHHRVGYGSDTITKPDGTVVEVKEGMKTTREDAERDLKRRVDQTQATIRGQIGNESWIGLSPKAKASLTSVFYNYGDNFGALAPVIAAARSGDETKIANAIRGLAGHNEGINAGRRAREANNIGPGDGTGAGIRPQGEAIREILNMRLPPQEEAAALGRLAHIYSAHRNDQTTAKAAFKQRVDDSEAEAMKTGTTQKPLIESDFTKQYGQDEGAARYADYAENLKFGGDYKNLQTMSDTEQQQFLAARTPVPGAPGFARAAKNQERLEKAVTVLQKERRDDPAGVVSRMPAVQAAMAQYDQNDPESFKRVVAARMAAQETLGIEPEYRSPITKPEALKYTAPLRRIIAGDTQGSLQALREIGGKFQQMFGDQADEAFAYALRAHKVEAEVAQQAGTVLRKLQKGERLFSEDVRGIDDASEMAAAQRTLGDRDMIGHGSGDTSRLAKSALGVLPMAAGERPSPFTPSVRPMTTEPAPRVQPQYIPPNAIEDLLKGALPPAKFDMLFGAGKAKEIQDKFTVPQGAQ